MFCIWWMCMYKWLFLSVVWLCALAFVLSQFSFCKIKVILGHKWNTFSVDTLIIITTTTVDMMVTFDSCGCDNAYEKKKPTKNCPAKTNYTMNRMRLDRSMGRILFSWFTKWCTHAQVDLMSGVEKKNNSSWTQHNAVIVIIAGHSKLKRC